MVLQGTYVEGIKEEVVLSPGHALSFIAAGEGKYFYLSFHPPVRVLIIFARELFVGLSCYWFNHCPLLL